jgi:hypothetical protein
MLTRAAAAARPLGPIGYHAPIAARSLKVHYRTEGGRHCQQQSQRQPTS